MKFQGFVGPTYQLKSVNVDSQRCVNLYPEIIESGTGKEGQQAYLKSTPGLELIASVGTGPIRLVHEDLSGQILVVSGKEVYKLIKTTAGVESIFPVKIGDIGINAAAPGPIVDPTLQVKAVSVFFNNEYFTIFSDGSYNNYAYHHDATYSVEGLGIVTDGGGIPLIQYAAFVDYLDGYIVYLVPANNKFYVSNLTNLLIVSPLDFATAEGNPDTSVAQLIINRLLYIFNEQSIEVYQNVGNADFPLERISGGYIEIGCLAPYSVAKINTSAFWLGRDDNGQGSVFMMKGLTHQRVSTHAVEQAINSYARPENAVGYAYTQNGHSFYILNFAEATWCYDISTGMWHERAFTNAGVLERHRANNLAFRTYTNRLVTSNYFGKYFCGDYSSNKVYLLKEGVYTDDSGTITRMRVSPHVSGSKNRVYHNSLEIDMETGVGLDGSVLGSDPQIMMSFSDDAGHSWSSEAWTSMGISVGGIGTFNTRVKWRRLGSSRDRVYKIVVTDPVKVTIIDAEIDAVVGGA